MKTVLASEMRELDRRTIEEFEVPGEVLMDRAGYGIADIARHLARTSGLGDALIQLFAGRGNNGGDAFVAARYLKKMGFNIEVYFAGEASAVSGDALKHLLKMRSEGIALRELPTLEDWEMLRATPQAAGDILIDGLLGTGITGPARGPVVGAIQVINAFARRGLVLAIDVPSGLNSDTGRADGDVVVADLTATMGLPKRGLVFPPALPVVGTVEVIDIGVPPALTEPLTSSVDMITIDDVARILGGRRSRISHKGSYGHVLLIGGAPGYAGAIGMAAMAAVRSGAGLVSVVTPKSVAPVVAGMVPEAMVHGAESNAEGSLAANALGGLDNDLSSYDAILVGPGMTPHSDTGEVLKYVLDAPGSVILDADALNVIATGPNLLATKRNGVILTPHPGEMARLLGCDTATVQDDRFDAASRAAEKFGATVILKGAGTVVAQEGHAPRVNLSGNPGMATGGMGDVLAGLTAGLAAQGMSPADAACAAVHIHGRAGDSVALLPSQAGMTATDVINELPQVFRGIQGR